MSGPGSINVVGGGLAGCSTAYFLRKRLPDASIRVIDPVGIAAAASGKGGGFIARDWGQGGVTNDLHIRGFELHAKLAEELGIKSYRRIKTFRVGVGRGRKGKNEVSWIDGYAESQFMDDATAQVDPREYTQAVFVASGAEYVKAAVTGLLGDSESCKGVQLSNNEVLSSDVTVIATGPWLKCMEEWANLSVPITGIKSTSCVWEPSTDRVEKEPAALFCSEHPKYGNHIEVYPRVGGEIYTCGLGGSDYVTGDRLKPGGDCDSADKIQADPSRVDAASKTIGEISSHFVTIPKVTQACMRPCLTDGLPALGAVSSGLYVCGAGNCWGISWSPAMGCAMADLIVDGKSDLAHPAFNPKRFTNREIVFSGQRGRSMGDERVGEQW